MKIVRLEIDGFGKWKDVSLSFDKPVTLIYGGNEAGKSTMLAFVRSILYGFARRDQPAERYEPMKGGIHGGSIIMQDEIGRIVRIERLDGARYGTAASKGSKSAGRLVITRDDDTHGGEEQLHEVLGGLRPELFRNIFAFGLDELQELRTLTVEEISAFMFNAGMGGDGGAVLRAERTINTEMDELFKPRGTKQELSRLMKEMSDIEQSVRRGKQSIDDYNEYVSQFELLERELEKEIAALPPFREELAWLEKCNQASERWERRTVAAATLERLTEKEDQAVYKRNQERKGTALPVAAVFLLGAAAAIWFLAEDYGPAASILTAFLSALLLASHWRRRVRQKRGERLRRKEQIQIQTMQQEEGVRLESELRQIDAFLESWIGADKYDRFVRMHQNGQASEVISRIDDIEGRISDIEFRINELRERRGALSLAMERLMQDIEPSELMQKFEEKSAQFQDRANRWAALALASELFKEAKRIHERERQPAVLRKAGEYFRAMTGGEYERVTAPIGEQRIVVERASGEWIDTAFLSRGTVEQLYLSIRFALAGEFAPTVRLPIIMDDIFVNFDAARLRHALRTIHGLSKTHQLIVFTCHEHVKQAAAEEIPDMKVIELPSSSNVDHLHRHAAVDDDVLSGNETGFRSS